jgi:hypothetical protein
MEFALICINLALCVPDCCICADKQINPDSNKPISTPTDDLNVSINSDSIVRLSEFANRDSDKTSSPRTSEATT